MAAKTQATNDRPVNRRPRARRSAADRFLRKEEAPGSNPGESTILRLLSEFHRIAPALAFSSQNAEAEQAQETTSESESTKDLRPAPRPAAVSRRKPAVRYQGKRVNGKCTVVAHEAHERRSIRKRTDLHNHSRGFEWGYCGSGPAQLALALLADALEDDELALKHYQQFKPDVVAHFEPAAWTITSDEIIEWLRRNRDEFHSPSEVSRGP